MAVIADLVRLCNHIITERAGVDSKKGVFGGRISGQRVCSDAWKLKKRKGGAGMRVEMQLGVGSGVVERSADLKLDLVTEGELREKGFLGLRKTKLVCTIGPACCSLEDLEKLAKGGMNVARLNMCHNTREWHREAIRRIKELNEEKGYSISVMIDTEGSQVNVVDHGVPSSIKTEVIIIHLLVKITV